VFEKWVPSCRRGCLRKLSRNRTIAASLRRRLWAGVDQRANIQPCDRPGLLQRGGHPLIPPNARFFAPLTARRRQRHSRGRKKKKKKTATQSSSALAAWALPPGGCQCGGGKYVPEQTERWRMGRLFFAGRGDGRKNLGGTKGRYAVGTPRFSRGRPCSIHRCPGLRQCGAGPGP